MTPTTFTVGGKEVTLREVEPRDIEACAKICFDAFGALHDHHRLPRDFPVLDATMGFMQMWIPHPKIWGVVAEVDGRVVGSNFIDERDPIRAGGPLTMEPDTQKLGIARKLLQASIDRSVDAPGVRAVQEGFNMSALALYISHGYDVKATCVLVSGTPRGAPVAGVDVQPLTEADLAECDALCKKVHGFERTGQLRDSILRRPMDTGFAPFTARRDGRLVAYASTLSRWSMAYGVAETDEDMRALLLGGAASLDGTLKILVPLQSSLFRWSLEQGLRAMKYMNLVVFGAYQEPRGSWFPSVEY